METYIVKRFHQLHCLASFRHTLQQASEGADIGTDWTDNRHWPHCLHYLRQSILCAADDTIELAAVINGTKSHFISGARDVRQCRNSNALYELMDNRGVVKHFGIVEEIQEPPPASLQPLGRRTASM